MLTWIQRSIRCARDRFRENDLDSVLWVVNLVPKHGGINILTDKISVPFWVIHMVLLIYVWAVGSAVFQIKYAQNAMDFIKSYVNVLVMILAINNSYWFIAKRSLLKDVLTLVKQNDDMCRKTSSLELKYQKRMSVVKKIVAIFYALNLIDAYAIDVPYRLMLMNYENSITPCVGIEPLTEFPARQICMAIMVIQTGTMISVVLSYQAILLFLIAHTSAMYQLLAEDMMLVMEDVDRSEHTVKENLAIFIRRHALILKTIDRIKDLYSVPLGINFALNAVCICFFFSLPLEEWVQLGPILVYCFLVFFLYCFLCQKLIDAAEKFETAVYSCGWENFNVKDQKLVYLMLIQAQQPILLLAADIIPVNIYTFATTLQAIYKFVTVLKV